MTDNESPSRKTWVEEAEEALNRTTEALKSAWDETREARMSTLEAAKEAANRLGKAIDQGIEVAKQTWEPSSREGGDTVSAVTNVTTDRQTSSEE
jgi:hypothetical protein